MVEKSDASPGAPRRGFLLSATMQSREAAMSCRCAERRVALTGLARALGRADARTAARSAHDIAQSLNRDAQDLAARLARTPRPRRP